MVRDTLLGFPSHSLPYRYRNSYHFIDSLRRGLYGRAGSFFAAPLQPRCLYRGAAKSLLIFYEFPHFRLHSAFSWDILILICYFRGEISV